MASFFELLPHKVIAPSNIATAIVVALNCFKLDSRKSDNFKEIRSKDWSNDFRGILEIIPLLLSQY